MLDLEGLAVLGGSLLIMLVVAVACVALGFYRWNRAISSRIRTLTATGLFGAVVVSIVIGLNVVGAIAVFAVLTLGILSIYKLLDTLFIRNDKQPPFAPRPVIQIEALPSAWTAIQGPFTLIDGATRQEYAVYPVRRD